MGYTSDAGYTPMTFDEIMDFIRQGVNDKYETSYTTESFVGTKFYKFFYPLVQRMQENEIKASEVFQKVLDFFNDIDAKILGPRNSYDGLIDVFADNGIEIAIRKPAEGDAGKIFICANISTDAKFKATIQDLTFESKATKMMTAPITVRYIDGVALDVSVYGPDIWVTIDSGVTLASEIKTAIETLTDSNNLVTVTVSGTASNTQVAMATDTYETLIAPDAAFNAKILLICELIRDYVAAGIISQGPWKKELNLSNGQLFEFCFYVPNRFESLLRLTITRSRNNRITIPPQSEIAATLLANINAQYRMGKDIEPERYFTYKDAPWASDILLEYKLDSGDVSWRNDVYESSEQERYLFDLSRIEIIEE